jgi:23S rRNA (adenine2503-C2)-methyltransferase
MGYKPCMQSIYAQNRQSINHICDELGLSQQTTDRFLGYLYRKPEKLETCSAISERFKAYLKTQFTFKLPKILNKQLAQDGTTKFLLQFEDGKTVETVLLPFWKKYSLCVSSQVGCAMNCSFCHTATQGLKRNLAPHEIIAQIMVAKSYLRSQKIDLPLTNVVFMGQGEPLHNFDNVRDAIAIISDPHGLSIGRKSITVSTSGYLPGLERFSELGGVNLALSLHSVRNEVRNELIPINRAYPFTDVLQQIDQISLKKRQTVEYEYLLIKDLNDTTEDARLLSELLQHRSHMINIIPFNPFPGSKYQRPSLAKVEKFKQELISHGLRAMIRTTKGDDILAACGQLKS